MKGEIVSEVVQQMLPFLDNVGVKKLQEVLEHTLFYYEVTTSKPYFQLRCNYYTTEKRAPLNAF